MDKIKKALSLIKTNKNEITQIIVCEDFMLKISKYKIEFSCVEEEYYLFGVPLLYSNMLKTGAILVMNNGENVVLNNI